VATPDQPETCVAKIQRGIFATLTLATFGVSCAVNDQGLELIHINLVLLQCDRTPAMSRHPLIPEVTFALTVKLILILAAALFVFSPGQRPKIDAESMQERLIGPSTVSLQARSILP
jgi:hypothetical protein